MLNDFDGLEVPCLCMHSAGFDEKKKNVVNGYDLFNIRELNGVVIIPFNRVADIKANAKDYPNSWISVLNADVFYDDIPFFVRDH